MLKFNKACLQTNIPSIMARNHNVKSQFHAISKPSFYVMKSGIVIELSMLLHKKLVSLVSKYLEDYARFLYRV